MELVRVDKQPFMATTGSLEARYYDQDFGSINFISRRKDGVRRKAYMDLKCGTPFPARSVLADPNRVRDALLSLNHSKSNLYGSDFNLGQAHKHLHLKKCIYSEGILCLFKLIYKIDIQSSKCFCKISKFKKKTWNECTCRSILRNFLLCDLTLLDLRLAFDHYLSLGTCALVKQYAKHFHA